MKVEKAKREPEKAASGAKSNKVWIIILSIFGVLIVGLIIAIVVVKNLPKGEMDNGNNDEPVTAEESAYNEYEKYHERAWEGIEYPTPENIQTVMERCLELAAETDDETVKAMLKTEYYQMMMVYDTTNEHKEEVLDGLIEVDNFLSSVSSACDVANAAYYYGDMETGDKYSAIASDRGGNLDVETEG